MAAVGAYLPLVADRWTPFVQAIRFTGIDLTADGTVLRAQVRLGGDAPGDPIVDLLTVDQGGTQGLRVTVAQEGDLPVSTVTLRINEPVMEAMPAAAELGDDAVLAWDLHITFGGLKQRRLYGPFIVRAGVTQA